MHNIGAVMAVMADALLKDTPSGLWTTRRQTNSLTANSPTDQLADNPTRRQTNSPTNKLAEIDIMTFRLTQKCNGNYESSALSL